MSASSVDDELMTSRACHSYCHVRFDDVRREMAIIIMMLRFDMMIVDVGQVQKDNNPPPTKKKQNWKNLTNFHNHTWK